MQLAHWKPWVLELRSAKATMQIPLLNVLDDIPTDTQVEGCVLDGGGLRHLPGIALEGMRVGSAWVGEGNLDLAGMLALEANHTCHFEENEGPLQANGHRLHEAILVSLGMNRRRTAFRAAIAFARLLNGEARTTLMIIDSAVLVATDAEHVIK